MQLTKVKQYLTTEAKAWLGRPNGQGEVVRVVPSYAPVGQQCYELYSSFEQVTENLGRILFDNEGYWIYDGNHLQVTAQEQVASFIINYMERL
jgi:hypothetical protein